MREKVLVYSRFPKALMQRIGERFELLDAAGKPEQDVFRADGLAWPASPAKGWYFADGAGAALPLADRESLWTLLAASGGRPVTVAGEWHPDSLVALTTWHGGSAVTL